MSNNDKIIRKKSVDLVMALSLITFDLSMSNTSKEQEKGTEFAILSKKEL
jgi:predicted GTPase